MGCCGKKSVPVEDDQSKNNDLHTKNPSDGDILHLGKNTDLDSAANNQNKKYNRLNSPMNSSFNRSFRRNNSSRRSTKTRRRGEYPYIIKEKDDHIELIIFADCFDKEKTLPIWVDQGKYVKFMVNGKWRIDPKYDYTTSEGKQTSNSVGFNYGALVGRIGSSEPFVVKNELIQYAEVSGPLYLRMQLPKNIKCEPDGQLALNIFDAQLLSVEEINRRIGWSESEELIEKKVEQSEIEYELITNLNNLRMNPTLFYEKHIEDYKNMIITKEYLYKFQNSNLSPFSIHNSATKTINFYFEQVNKEKSVPKQVVSSELSKIEKNVKDYVGYNLGNSKIISSAKIGKKYNAVEMCLLYLFDEEFRDNIFSKEYGRIAVKVMQNYFGNNHLIIVCLFKAQTNSKFK